MFIVIKVKRNKDGEIVENKNDPLFRRVAICVNSLARIPEHLLDSYEVLVIDECAEFRRHFIGETMKNVLLSSISILRRLLLFPRKYVFLMQYRLSENDISFYTKLGGFDMYDRNKIYSLCFSPLNKIRRVLNVSFDLNVIRGRLMEYISEHCPQKQL